MSGVRPCITPEQTQLLCAQSLASWVSTARKINTDEWMHGLAVRLNNYCEALGEEERYEYDGSDWIQLQPGGPS